MSNIEVKFGKKTCVIKSLSNTQIACVTEPTSEQHSVNNSGTHPKLGRYYAWNPPMIVVEVIK